MVTQHSPADGGMEDAGRRELASLVAAFRQWGPQTAVVRYRGNRSDRTSYAEVASLAGRFASELDRRGVAMGERVVIWGGNSAEWIGVLFGCLLRGVLAVPLDAAGTVEFAARVVGEVRPVLVVGDRALLQAYMLAGGVESGLRLAFEDLDALLPAKPEWRVRAEVTPETPFQIVFTSGTTSEPKGIVHTHRNVLASLGPIEREIRKYRRYERLVHPLRFLHTLPLSHVFGQFLGLWVPVLVGAEVHFESRADASRLVYEARRVGANVLVAVPRVLDMVRLHLLSVMPGLAEEIQSSGGLRVWERWWQSRRAHARLGWRFWAVISGGATVTPELEQFWAALGLPVIQGYGMTETAALVTLNHPFRVARGTLGETLPGREVRLGKDGEILVRGEMLSGATWRNGEMQARAGEWLATGDLAVRNERGELRFAGRKGDVIVTAAGMNVHPADLEAAMIAQSGVRECVVVGCPLGGGTEPVAAVLFAGQEAHLRSAVQQANQGLAAYQQIRRAVRWPELQFPYTATGKLLRRRVAERVCGMLLAEADGRVGESNTGDPLLAVIEEVTRERLAVAKDVEALRLTEDLHLDSLGRVELQAALEQRLGAEIGDAAMAAAATVRELRRLVELRRVPGGSAELSGAAAEVAPREARESAGRKGSALPDGTRDRLVLRGQEPRYPRWPWWRPVQWVRSAFGEAVVRPLVRWLGKPRVERVPDPAGNRIAASPALVVANHVTAFDGALVMATLPKPLRRRLAVAMSGEVMAEIDAGTWAELRAGRVLGPVVVWLLRALFNVFPLPRLRGFRRSFQHAGEAMDRGYSVLVFPEGRRSKTGALLPFRAGIGLLAEELRAPVVPVGLVGLRASDGDQKRWFRSGRVVVRVGAPMLWVEGRSPETWTATLEGAVRGLLEEVVLEKQA